MNSELEKLIDIAAKGTVITDRQRELISKKAINYNEDPDEVEFLLDLKYKDYHKPIAESTISSIESHEDTDETNVVRQAVAPLVNLGNSIRKPKPIKGKRRILAAVLAFFLGGFGVHKFYLGDIKSGILYILFCWTGIPFILGWIDFFILIFESDEKFYSQIK